ncbi:hypothetical protein [Rhodococcus sp. NCIMB 12038]|uniref:hypothetical protein n=1 Tax=Rhodococcus sp. NCIMB 12038 TaxID=933800 RepID=UPI000B3C434B|nr:hypothetical protein [Rhodococcus sp. NCIMB 12038]OUS97334.1 hypothetical protein CA951_03015 [Rhodococcus sp. NCIMB 12038]
MIEVEATHITNHKSQRHRRLVCELYPGILVIYGHGASSVNTFGGRVEPIRSGSGLRFRIPDHVVDEASLLYDKLMNQAARARLDRLVDPRYKVWPPARWPSRHAKCAKMKVEATHITIGSGPERLVCELHPGILMMDGLGVRTVLNMGNAVESLPAGGDRIFSMTAGQAAAAALTYGQQLRRRNWTWPPPHWVGRSHRD